MAFNEMLSLIPHSTLIIAIFTCLGALIGEYKRSEYRKKEVRTSKMFLDFISSWLYGFGVVCFLTDLCDITNSNLLIGLSILVSTVGYNELFKICKKYVNNTILSKFNIDKE